MKIKMCKIIILPFVLYGCETRSHTLREKCRLRVFENRILRRIFGPKWRRLHNEELHSLCCSRNVIRVIKSRRLIWTEHVTRIEEGRSAFKILTGKPTRRRLLGRPRLEWEDNIRVDLNGIGVGIIGEPLSMQHSTSGFHKPWS